MSWRRWRCQECGGDWSECECAFALKPEGYGMEKKKYPLIKELGLRIEETTVMRYHDGTKGKVGKSYFARENWVLADDIERVLAAGVKVEGWYNEGLKRDFWSPQNWEPPHMKRDRQALLINIKPIEKPDSLEQLAKDLANYHADLGGWPELQERAKKLAGKL